MGAAVSGRFVVLCGGKILDYGAVAARIPEDAFVICADSGYDHCERLGRKPDLLVGDFDSVRSALPEGVPRLPLSAEKDYTDAFHAVEEALRRGCRHLLMAGALGGRLDHTLANLQILTRLSRTGVESCLTDGLTDVCAVTDGALLLPPREGYYFSLLALTQRCEGVTITGARYPLEEYTLTFDCPRAVSNEFLDGPASVAVRGGTLAVLLVPMDL